MSNDRPMGLGDHLDELRRRLIFALLGLLPIVIVGLLVGTTALGWIVAPLEAQLRAAGEPAGLLATGPLESFVSYLKVSFGIAVLVALPWLLYQFWLFVAPGLYPRERRFVYVLLPGSAALTLTSVLFLFKVLLPISLFFLIEFGSGLATVEVPRREADEQTIAQLMSSRLPLLDADPLAEQLEPGMVWLNTARNQVRIAVPERRTGGEPEQTAPRTAEPQAEGTGGADIVVRPPAGSKRLAAPPRVMALRLGGDGLIAQEYRVGEYVSLVFRLMIVFALAFQLPLVMLLLGWVGILDRRFAGKYRRHVGFGCAVAGAMLTPQDPWSMILLGGALYLLYELGLVLMRFLTPEVVGGGAPGRGEDDGARRRTTDSEEGDE